MSAETVPSDPTGATYLLVKSQADVGNRKTCVEGQVERVPIGLSTLAPGVAIYTGGNLNATGNGTISGPLQNGQPIASTVVYKNFRAAASGTRAPPRSISVAAAASAAS